MGAALLKHPEKVRQILTALVEGISIPVTCKIRILPTVSRQFCVPNDVIGTMYFYVPWWIFFIRLKKPFIWWEWLKAPRSLQLQFMAGKFFVIFLKKLKYHIRNLFYCKISWGIGKPNKSFCIKLLLFYFIFREQHERPRHPVHKDIIHRVAKELNISVISNGGSADIINYEDMDRFQEETGTDSVMVARAAQWNPSVFRCVLDPHLPQLIVSYCSKQKQPCNCHIL